MVHGNVLDLAHLLDVGERKLDWVFDQTADLEFEVTEAAFRQMLPIVTDGQFPVRSEVRRDVLLGVMLLWHKFVQCEQLHWINDELEGMLQPAWVTPREVVRRDP